MAVADPSPRGRFPLAALLAPADLPAAALAALTLAALALGVAGYEHAHLFHQGYAQVPVVGPLFFLNGVAAAVTILLLVFGRALLFCLSALAMSVGAIVSIVLSHTSSFLGFAEGGWDGGAKLSLGAECAVLALTLIGMALAGRRLVAPAARGAGG